MLQPCLLCSISSSIRLTSLPYLELHGTFSISDNRKCPKTRQIWNVHSLPSSLNHTAVQSNTCMLVMSHALPVCCSQPIPVILIQWLLEPFHFLQTWQLNLILKELHNPIVLNESIFSKGTEYNHKALTESQRIAPNPLPEWSVWSEEKEPGCRYHRLSNRLTTLS